MTGILIRRGDTATDTEGRGHMMTEAEIVMLQLQAKENQGLPATVQNWERQGRILL